MDVGQFWRAGVGHFRRAPKDPREELQVAMMDTVIAEPLLSRLQNAGPQGRYDVIISANDLYEEGPGTAVDLIEERLQQWQSTFNLIGFHIAAWLNAQQLFALAEETRRLTEERGAGGSPIFRIWEDGEIELALTQSIVTIKADAAQRAFAATGKGIVWAILDSGIDGTHPHFRSKLSAYEEIDTLSLPPPLKHVDFTPAADGALIDRLTAAFSARSATT